MSDYKRSAKLRKRVSRTAASIKIARVSKENEDENEAPLSKKLCVSELQKHNIISKSENKVPYVDAESRNNELHTLNIGNETLENNFSSLEESLDMSPDNKNNLFFNKTQNESISLNNDYDELENLNTDDEISDLEYVADDIVEETICASFESNKKSLLENKKCETVRDVVKDWALNSGTPHVHVDTLLEGLRKFHPELPKSSKCLLETYFLPKSNIKNLNADKNINDDGKFLYIGLEKQLVKVVNPDLHKDKKVKVMINIDGLKLFNSGNIEFWPILGKVFHEGDVYLPFEIAIWCGPGKPKNLDIYVEDFINECNKLTMLGFTVDGIHFEFELMCFICDRPARSFLKCIKGHTGYFSCERCCVEGVWLNYRICFLSIYDQKRTHYSFIKQSDPNHHVGTTPLTKLLSIDFEKKFVLDFMHLGPQGVQKKLLNDFWISNKNTKLSDDKLAKLYKRLRNLASQILFEFQRTTRADQIPDWKATELRFFMYYCGVFVMKNLLPDDMYNHYLLLYVATRILHCDKLCLKYAEYAQQYLDRFVLLCNYIYGAESLVSNFHNLSHVVDALKFFKCSLSLINCFSFENKLQQIKKKLRSGNEPLSQFYNRFSESESVKKPKPTLPLVFEILKKKRNNNGTWSLQLIKYNNCKINTYKPNNVVLMNNNNIIEINEIFSYSDKNDIKHAFFNGNKLNIDFENEAFSYPTSASVLNIYKIKNDFKSKICNQSFLDCTAKMIVLDIYEDDPYEKESYAVPLLHM